MTELHMVDGVVLLPPLIKDNQTALLGCFCEEFSYVKVRKYGEGIQVGDKVILSLCPCDQHSLGHPMAAMLDQCSYGPFAVIWYIGIVAYWSPPLPRHFPYLRLVDKAIFMGGGVDRDSTSRMSQPPSPSPTSSSAMPDDAEEDVPRKEVEKKSGRKERPKREASNPANTEAMYHTNKG